MPRLFVNVDHVATIRQARGVDYPDPLEIARLAEDAGADGITVHLREDRRHIQDDDVRVIAAGCRTPFNFELSVAEEIVALCEELTPPQATLVPERREELTTEGGLDVDGAFDRIAAVTARLRARGTDVSLFIDPNVAAVDRSKDCGATHIELHTGAYADAPPQERPAHLDALRTASARAVEIGLVLNAGHGLTTDNVGPIAAIPDMNDLNIGHFLVARSIAVGMPEAVGEMRRAMRAAAR